MGTLVQNAVTLNLTLESTTTVNDIRPSEQEFGGRAREIRRSVGDRCITCHKLGGRGNAVGPNLAGVRRRTPDELLWHILAPNREVAPDSLEYLVSVKDGRVLTGLIESEGATGLVLKRAEGVTDAVLQGDIDAMISTGKSLMPEGLEAKIAPREMADLIAYLLSLQEL